MSLKTLARSNTSTSSFVNNIKNSQFALFKKIYILVALPKFTYENHFSLCSEH